MRFRVEFWALVIGCYRSFGCTGLVGLAVVSFVEDLFKKDEDARFNFRRFDRGAYRSVFVVGCWASWWAVSKWSIF